MTTDWFEPPPLRKKTMSENSYKLKSAATPITLEKEDGTVLEITMKEMDAASRDRYLDELSTRMRFDAEGRPAGIKKFEGMQADLLALCLFNPDGKGVIKMEIQKWPASVVSDLFKKAQAMNHLTQETEIKND